MKEYEVLLAVRFSAESREDANDAAHDVADSIAGVYLRNDIVGATVLLLGNDDHFDVLGIKRHGELVHGD